MPQPKPLRLTNPEIEVIRESLPTGKVADRIREKLAKAQDMSPTKELLCTISTAHGALEGILGVGTVALPPHPDDAWFKKMTQRLREHQLTEDDFKVAAAKVKVRWNRPPYSFERIIYNMDRLHAEETNVLDAYVGPAPITEW